MDQIEEIKNKTDIVQLISEAVTLKKAGRNFKGLCPFHEEKSPSFMVSPERQMFKCFGCQIGGDVFKFIMERERLEFGEALRLLADRAGVQLKDFRPSQDQQIKDRLLEINHLASEYYHYLLTEHSAGKRALDYLLKRGISKSSIKTFKLGFSANEWEGLRHYLTRKKNYRDEDLERAGLVITGQKGYYDRFRDRVIFPLFDHRSRVVGFSGRVFDKESKEAKYVNSPETLIYHKSEILYGLEITKEAIKKADKAVVVEGELDLISSYQAGVTNIVAIKGSALTEAQIDLLKRFCGHLVLALDMDSAGDAASRRGIELAETKGLNVRVIRLAYGKDPDECAQHSARMWKDSVAAAVPVYDFYLESAQKRFGVDSPEGKRQISDELSPVLARISNEVIKDHYVKKLAGLLGVSEEAVLAEVNKKFTPRRPGEAAPAQTGFQSRQERLEQYLLVLVLALNQSMASAVKQIKVDSLTNNALSQVLAKLQEWFAVQKTWEINQFIKTLPEELAATVDTAYLTDLKQLGGDAAALANEFDNTLAELSRLATKTKTSRLTAALDEAETGQDKAKIKALKAELVETTRLLGYNHD